MGRRLDGALRRALAEGDRGDVPGWVLVTLMTAGLVLGLWRRPRAAQAGQAPVDTEVPEDGGADDTAELTAPITRRRPPSREPSDTTDEGADEPTQQIG